MRIFLATLAFALTCSTGVVAKPARLTPEAVAAFKVGQATEADVIAKFGRPMMSMTGASDDQVLVYSAGAAHIKATTFLPVVGLFASGVKTGNTTYSFTFGADGKLQSVTSTTMNMNCSSSFFAASCH